MRLKSASTASQRLRDTRRNIWTHRVHGGNRSKNICRRSAERAQARHKLRHIGRATKKKFNRKMRSCGGIVSCLYSSAIRPTVWWRRRGNTLISSSHGKKRQRNCLPHMRGITSSSIQRSRTSGQSCNRCWTVAWGNSHMAKCARSFRDVSRVGNFAPSVTKKGAQLRKHPCRDGPHGKGDHCRNAAR